MIDAFHYYGPLLRLLPAEVAHDATVRALAAGLGPRSGPPVPALACRLFGKDLRNPFGIAAGFDKNAEAVDGLVRLGFGFVEVGTVTPRPQPGNPRPRLFRLRRDHAVINRMGFNNDGLTALAARLGRFRAGPHGGAMIAVNIGKNKDTADAAADYVAGVEGISELADFIVVNISSPNTPGLRALQGKRELEELLSRVRDALGRVPSRRPLFVKIAPDLAPADREDIAEVALAMGIDGLVVSNTTVERPASLRGKRRGETGGLSGRPLLAPSTQLLREMARLTGGKLKFIGVGGVSSGEDAYAKIRAGASLVQLYTALIYEGPGLLWRMERELAALLARDGFRNVSEAVGADQR